MKFMLLYLAAAATAQQHFPPGNGPDIQHGRHPVRVPLYPPRPARPIHWRQGLVASEPSSNGVVIPQTLNGASSQEIPTVTVGTNNLVLSGSQESSGGEIVGSQEGSGGEIVVGSQEGSGGEMPGSQEGSSGEMPGSQEGSSGEQVNWPAASGDEVMPPTPSYN
jgi:hypothetical protein